MLKEYDFSKAVKNPYSDSKKSLISIRLNTQTLKYFKKLAKEAGLPYQTLINSYLTDCALKNLRPKTIWSSETEEQDLS